MTNGHLTTLLQRFMDGDTTVDEEVRLARFFEKATDADRPEGVSPDDWRAYREMFAMFGVEAAGDGTRHVADRRGRRLPLWRTVAWGASAAAVALALVVTGVGVRRDAAGVGGVTPDGVAVATAGAAADSVVADPVQRADGDSADYRVPKAERRARRPYWQPRAPKVYMAHVAGADSVARPDNNSIEAAVAQADILLRAITVSQTADIQRLQSQAMEVFDDDEVAGDSDQ